MKCKASVSGLCLAITMNNSFCEPECELMCKNEECKTPNLENFYAGLCHMCFLALFSVSSKKR